MLTISQLASYAGVTVRAVRHYHQVGLLPEPERDRSGYRSYDAQAVVELIRIRTLANAGVPLAQVPELLDASPEKFGEAVREIDRRLGSEIRRLQRHREEIAELAAGDSLALPEEAVAYLGMLRDVGVCEEVIEVERDAWILIAAQWPERMAAWMADKRRQFDDPRMVRLYQLLDPAEMATDDPRLHEAADLLVELTEEWATRPQPDELAERTIVGLLDSFADHFASVTDRLQELLNERGWAGWTHLERTRVQRGPAGDVRPADPPAT
ncbi:MerR family transcriptional regulator [Streptomyces oceani]|uniref:MerR family transcriptional regulator n=1 Tax=Streptomyces oceani TaxID=1075402 RepID=A0A1E7KFV0_9ACTN|nr:MerR family transcriptional regulator [Streptomyces oceani]OEV02809.1 MerR family transcriptional regulator [Streptomyces oceani]